MKQQILIKIGQIAAKCDFLSQYFFPFACFQLIYIKEPVKKTQLQLVELRLIDREFIEISGKISPVQHGFIESRGIFVNRVLAQFKRIGSFAGAWQTGVFSFLLGLLPVAAFAQAEQPPGFSVDGQTHLQAAATPIMDSIVAFHDGVLLWIITAIVGFVSLVLLYIMVRYNSKVNPTPSKTTHNTMIEIVWTVAPIVILIVIAVPSFGVLADQQTIPDGVRKYLGSNIFSYGEVDLPAPELTIKATGVQWNWDYDYMDYEGADFSSFMLSDEERLASRPDEPRLLSADFELVVPVETTVRVLVTASDVIHSFAVPAFGIKVDAVPGRLNETWFNAQRTGMFYGQCSELCGKDHAFMPIAVRVVSKDEFAKWIAAVQADGVEDALAVLSPIS